MNRILIIREGANGDVLVAAAVAPALKKKYPDSTISFYTRCPGVLTGNPYIDHVIPMGNPLTMFDKIIDLDLAYENRPFTNILQAYANQAGVDRDQCELFVATAPVNKPLLKDYVVMHCGKTKWAGRNWDQAKWRSTALRIHEWAQIVVVGSGEDIFVPCDVDARNKTTIPQLATIIKDASLFVGIDSLPMHIAQAMGTPGAVFFGSVLPETRILKNNIRPMTAQVACLGCHNRKPVPCKGTIECERIDLACENLLTVQEAAECIQEVMNLSQKTSVG